MHNVQALRFDTDVHGDGALPLVTLDSAPRLASRPLSVCGLVRTASGRHEEVPKRGMALAPLCPPTAGTDRLDETGKSQKDLW